MRILISTGEVSGDLQGSLLVKALQAQAQLQEIDLEILAVGGDRLQAAGAKLIANTNTIGSIGIVESLPFILPTLQIQKRIKAYLKANPPDILVLIDYAGPNLSLGSYVREKLPHIPIIYYIAPQNWVWSTSPKNTQKLIQITDKFLAIFPEEARYFQAKGADVTWVGHPLLDRMITAPNRQESRQNLGIKPEEIAIALIPASRHQEIKYLLPLICQAAAQIQQKLPQVHFYLPLSLASYRHPIEQIIKNYNLAITLVESKTLEVIAAADLAITKSGTVNLEIGMLNVPQVVIYRVNPFTMFVARKILNFSIPFMSPVNLMVMKEIVPELLQEKATVENIVQASLELLLDQAKRAQTLANYEIMRQNLGEVGVCQRAAAEIINFRIAQK